MEPKHFPARRLDRNASEWKLQTEAAIGQPFVYRFYDADQQPLYIGMTHTSCARLVAHRNRSEWWPLAEYIAISTYPSWTATEVAEKAAIRAERPRFNKAGMRWRTQIIVRLDQDPRVVAEELHRVGRPEFLQKLAELLAQPGFYNFPAPPPPADFQGGG